MKDKLIRIRHGIYAIPSGRDAMLVIERARFTLRRGGRRLGHWLRYLVGMIVRTGEKIAICLGEASRIDIESWLASHEDDDVMLAYRWFEHMLATFGIAKCIALAAIATRRD